MERSSHRGPQRRGVPPQTRKAACSTGHRSEAGPPAGHQKKRSGETGIRTLGHLAESPVFKTGHGVDRSSSGKDIYESFIAPGGARFGARSHDPLTWVDAENILGRLVERWESLPAWAIQAIAKIADLSVMGEP